MLTPSIRLRLVGLMWLAARLLSAAVTDQPLTSDTARKAAAFFEWVLDVQFSHAQQTEYEQILAREWDNPANRKSVLEMVRGLEKLSSVSEEKKRQLHGQVQGAMLESLRKNTKSEDSRWLLAIYEAAHQAPNAEIGVSQTPGKLIGKWRESKSSSVQYGNRTTGALAPTNGSSFFYRFDEDGTYEYNGLMQVTTYGCLTQIYNQDSGTFQLSGDILTLYPAGGSVKVNQNCGSTGNTNKPADLSPRQYRFHFEQQGDIPILVIGNVNGNSRPDYFRAER